MWHYESRTWQPCILNRGLAMRLALRGARAAVQVHMLATHAFVIDTLRALLRTGSYSLRYKLLNSVFNELEVHLANTVAALEYVTLTTDFWTDALGRAVCAMLVTLNDRTSHVVQVLDASDQSHTGVFIKGVLAPNLFGTQFVALVWLAAQTPMAHVAQVQQFPAGLPVQYAVAAPAASVVSQIL